MTRESDYTLWPYKVHDDELPRCAGRASPPIKNAAYDECIAILEDSRKRLEKIWIRSWGWGTECD